MRKRAVVYTTPTSSVTLNTLKMQINAINNSRQGWRYYRWFYATQTLEDMPVGPNGSVIYMPGIIKECHRGWFMVANTASKRELYHWKHWKSCISVTYNTELLNLPKMSIIERRLGSDPNKWIEVMSSKNPEDWIYQHGAGLGRPKKVLDTEEEL